MNGSTQLRVLGPLEVILDGRARRIGSPIQRTLLALLVMHPNEVVSTDRIVDVLWPDDPPEGRRKLWFHVSKLRAILQPGGAEDAAGPTLATHPTGYVLRIETEKLDACRFERLTRSARSALEDDPTRAAELLRQALNLWRGEPFQDVLHEDAVSSEVGRLNELRLAALEDRLEADLALGRAGELIPELEALVAKHPFREQLRAKLMLALYRAGRQADALAAYRQTRRTLVEELGIEPSDELRELHKRILDHDRVLAGTAAPPARTTAPREERKIVTVFFADLLDATARAEPLDPEDVRAFLSPYHARIRSELERFGGTVEEAVANGFTALFGVPAAHEDDPERAVRAALAIRDWMIEQGDAMHTRIAVATGEALVTLGAVGSAREPIAVGGCSRSRMRSTVALPTGSLFASAAIGAASRYSIASLVLRNVCSSTSTPSTGAASRRPAAVLTTRGAKRTDQPVRVWEVVHARARFGVDLAPEAHTPLVGRARELDQLVDALARVREQGSPELVTLVGVPGIGKSRLVGELFRSIERGGVLTYWRQGRSLPYGEGVSYWGLAEMVKAQAAILESDDDDAVEAKLERAVKRLIDEDAVWVLSHLRPLVGQGDAAGSQEEAFAAWRRFFEALAEQHPLVLVFEDIQWADDGLLDFIEHLADWVTDVPMLILCTARRELLERRPGWGGGKVNAATIALVPLTDEQTAQLIAALSDPPLLEADAQSALLDRAGGNPLYAEQYVRMLAERGSADDLPETVQGIIAARLDSLPLEEKALLHRASVVGKVFWLGSLDATEQQLHALQRKEFVQRARRSSVAGENEYAFRHLLVRDVAYGQIPRAERARKHVETAEWIESLGRSEDHAETLAHHYVQALELARACGEPTDELAERGRLALRDAGDRAKALNAFDAAAEFYESALRLWPDDGPERPRVVLAHSETQWIGRGRVGDDLEQAIDDLVALGDHERAAIALILLAEEQWQAGRRDGADFHLERALALLEDAPSSGAKARVLSEASRYHMLAGRDEEALRISREALAMATALGLDDVRVHALNYLGGSRIRLGDAGGIDDMERSVALANEIGSIESLRSYNNLFATLVNLGLLDRAAEAVSAGLRAAERFGAPRGASLWLRYERVNVSYWQGRWEDMLQLIGEILAEVGPIHALSRWAYESRGRVRLARGDEAGAIDDATKSLELAREAKDPQTLHPALAFIAFALVSAHRDREAEPFADELLALDVAGLLQVPAASPVFDLVWVVAALRRSAELLHALENTNVPSPWTEAAAEIARGRYQRAADIYADMGTVPNEAFTRLRAAEHLLREGRRAEADEQLNAALTFYRGVRATRYVREGEALLAASA